MRIIAGEKRGAKLFAPEDKFIRPTTDRVKESLFGILQFVIADTNVMDLCCGSGNLGLEALSRGAESATFIDIDEKSIELLNKNIDKLGYQEKSAVIKSDSRQALKELSLKQKQFDYILFDPPYNDLTLYKDIIEYVLQNKLLTKDGALIVEHGAKYIKDPVIEERMYDMRKYGSTYISFYR